MSGCPTCESPQFYLFDDGRGQCYALTCGLRHLAREPASLVRQAFERIYRTFHRGVATAPRPLPFDVAVVAHSMVGCVPPNLSLDAELEPFIATARDALVELLDTPKRGRSSKAFQAQLATAQEAVNGLKELHKGLQEVMRAHGDALCFFWTDAAHEIVRVTAGEMSIGRGGVFNHGLHYDLSPASPSTHGLRGRFIGVETPEEALAIQSHAAAAARRNSEHPQAGYVWSGAVADVNVVRGFTRMPLMFVSNTGAGNNLAHEMKQVANLHVFHPPDHKAVGEWLIRVPLTEKGWNAIVNLRRTATLLTRPFERVREQLDSIRNVEGKQMKKFEVDRIVGQEIGADLGERGEVFFDGQEAYVKVPGVTDLVTVDPNEREWMLLAQKYGIAPTDAIAKPLALAVRHLAIESGTPITLRHFSHYAKRSNTLYIFDGERHIYKVTTEAIVRVPNGTDRVFFARRRTEEPFTLVENPKELPDVAQVLCQGMSFTMTAISREMWTGLLNVYLLALFFTDIFATRPILAPFGPAGSGKTSFIDRIGKLIEGNAFKVSDLTNDPRDLDAALTTEFFVAIDNADRPLSWLSDKLAIIATGGTIKRRQYFTTSTLADYPICAWVAITSRTPRFRREDVAERLLPVGVERLCGFAAQQDLLETIDANRNLLLTSLVHSAQKLLRILALQRDQPPMTTNFRMADFAIFAHAAKRVVRFPGDVEDVLSKLAAAQTAFTVEDCPLFELLDGWLKGPGSAGRKVTTGTLFEELHEPATALLKAYPSPQAFGQAIADNDQTLRRLYRMQTGSGGGGTKWVKLYPKPAEPRGEGDGSDT